jgi:hypothetical protein
MTEYEIAVEKRMAATFTVTASDEETAVRDALQLWDVFGVDKVKPSITVVRDQQ